MRFLPFVYFFADNIRPVVFADPASDVIDATAASAANRYFRYLSTDSLNQSVLYAGAA